MRKNLVALAMAGLLAVGLNGVTAISASAHVPGGLCIQPDQTVSSESVAGYDDVLQVLDRIERTSGGLVIVKSAGQSGEGRELMYATVGTGPSVFWPRRASTATSFTARKPLCRSLTTSRADHRQLG